MDNNLFNNNTKDNIKSLAFEFIGIVTIAIVLVLIIQSVAEKAVVVGSSMEPNLSNEQRILVNKVAYVFSDPKRGDIIIFDPPVASENDYIKRIIGLPGEVVEIKDGTVYIHQKDDIVIALDESGYIVDDPDYEYTSGIVPDNCYFVLGDNRNNSGDSHYGWFVSRSDIDGKAWFSYWPISDFGFVLNYSFN